MSEDLVATSDVYAGSTESTTAVSSPSTPTGSAKQDKTPPPGSVTPEQSAPLDHHYQAAFDPVPPPMMAMGFLDSGPDVTLTSCVGKNLVVRELRDGDDVASTPPGSMRTKMVIGRRRSLPQNHLSLSDSPVTPVSLAHNPQEQPIHHIVPQTPFALSEFDPTPSNPEQWTVTPVSKKTKR